MDDQFKIIVTVVEYSCNSLSINSGSGSSSKTTYRYRNRRDSPGSTVISPIMVGLNAKKGSLKFIKIGSGKFKLSGCTRIMIPGCSPSTTPDRYAHFARD